MNARKHMAGFALLVVGLVATVLAQQSTSKQVDEERLDMWISVVMPFESPSPQLKIIYSHVGGKVPIKLAMPGRNQFPLYRGVDILIDGDAPKFKDPRASSGLFIFSRVVEVGPDETAELIVPINEIIVLPDGWRKLEITPTQIHRLSGVAQGITITRK